MAVSQVLRRYKLFQIRRSGTYQLIVTPVLIDGVMCDQDLRYGLH